MSTPKRQHTGEAEAEVADGLRPIKRRASGSTIVSPQPTPTPSVTVDIYTAKLSDVRLLLCGTLPVTPCSLSFSLLPVSEVTAALTNTVQASHPVTQRAAVFTSLHCSHKSMHSRSTHGASAPMHPPPRRS